MAVTWQLFESAASSYEAWYTTRRGQRAAGAEQALLVRLLAELPEVRSVLEVGTGSGHFAAGLAQSGFHVVGLERAPAMVKEARRQPVSLALVIGDAHQLPIRAGCVDAVVFVTTLEFLDEPVAALREAVRVARRAVVAIVLNRLSLGGISRRWGRQARGPLLGVARDYSLGRLRRELKQAAGTRRGAMRWSSTLFPNGLWKLGARVPLGDAIGVVAALRADY